MSLNHVKRQLSSLSMEANCLWDKTWFSHIKIELKKNSNENDCTMEGEDPMITFHLNQYICHQVFNRNNCLYGMKTSFVMINWEIAYQGSKRKQIVIDCEKLVILSCHNVSIEVATCFFSRIFKFNYANDKKHRHAFFSNFKAFYCDIIHIFV